MSVINFCPECDKSISGIKSCHCGWKVPKHVEKVEIDYLCHYQLEGKRCPLPGSICPNPFGKTWYCTEHWRYLGDPKSSATFLQYAEENYHEIMAKRCDWRRKLFEYEGKN